MELTNTIHNNPQYASWLSGLKDKVRNARIKAAVTVNRELLSFYWELGADIVQKIESSLYHREGKAITNFTDALPQPQSDLAQQTLNDPYIFDFLALTKDYNERELENKLVEHITHFLLELGAGFAYIGRQVPVQVGERDFFIDLLFYHARLHCYVVIELKTTDFEPEHAGKLNFYIKVVVIDKVGMKGKADKGKTGYIKTTDLVDYVESKVPEIAEKHFKRKQYPTTAVSGQGFPIGKTKQ